MSQRKPTEKPKRLVWRISPSAPMGEWVDLDAPPKREPRAELPEVTSGGWVPSSFDLLRGTEVIEGDVDTVPDDLFDELFGASNDDPTKRHKPEGDDTVPNDLFDELFGSSNDAPKKRHEPEGGGA